MIENLLLKSLFKRNLKFMKLSYYDYFNVLDQSFQYTVDYFPKLEFLEILGTPTEYFIKNFLLKLPYLKYFTIPEQSILSGQSGLESECKSIDCVIQELLNRKFHYTIVKSGLTTQDRPSLPYYNMNFHKLLIFSPNTIDFTYIPESRDAKRSALYLFAKKLYKGDPCTPIYFAYSIGEKTAIRFVLESEFIKN